MTSQNITARDVLEVFKELDFELHIVNLQLKKCSRAVRNKDLFARALCLVNKYRAWQWVRKFSFLNPHSLW